MTRPINESARIVIKTKEGERGEVSANGPRAVNVAIRMVFRAMQPERRAEILLALQAAHVQELNKEAMPGPKPGVSVIRYESKA